MRLDSSRQLRAQVSSRPWRGQLRVYHGRITCKIVTFRVGMYHVFCIAWHTWIFYIFSYFDAFMLHYHVQKKRVHQLWLPFCYISSSYPRQKNIFGFPAHSPLKNNKWSYVKWKTENMLQWSITSISKNWRHLAFKTHRLPKPKLCACSAHLFNLTHLRIIFRLR